MPETASNRWSLSPYADISLRNWNDEYVVHHALSNDTHRLTGLGGRLLTALSQAGTLDEDVLAHRCAADIEDARRTLAALAELDLVGRC